MLSHKICTFLFFLSMFVAALNVSAQEVQTTVEYNHSLLNLNHNINSFSKKAASDIVTLPFLDDFSTSGPYPDQSLWVDSNVYVNDDFSVDPLSIGVATFDGANKFGKPYQSLTKTYSIADYLTSKPINLKEHDNIFYSKADSIYLSFFYQPQGNGNQPQASDSLVLEFKSPIDSVWIWKWGVPGTAIKPFKQVMIPIKEDVFFRNDFQFRFKNYTSYSGALDHWNIDYVRIDKGRSRKDTLISDIAFVERAPVSLLKNYNSVPWTHFKTNGASELKTTISLRVRNNSGDEPSRFYSFNVKDENGMVTSGVETKTAFTAKSRAYYTIANITVPPSIFPDNGKDSAVFTVEKLISFLGSDIYPGNDKLISKQQFYNYYAYDDGTAESAYGITESGAKLAYKFTTLKTDTLRGISIMFNQMIEDVSLSTFKLAVWDKIGASEHIVYQSDKEVSPIYEDVVNGFHTYKLDKELIVSGTFYIGWIQNTNKKLNLGVDLNTSVTNLKNYYLPSTGEWFSSTLKGAWMIRPVFGKALPVNVGISETVNQLQEISIYPNPASDKLNLSLTDDIMVQDLEFSISDMMGRKQQTTLKGNSIDVSPLASGLYFLTISTSKNKAAIVKKVVIGK